VPFQLSFSFPEFFGDEIVAQPVGRMVHFTPWGEVFAIESKGFVIHRDRFDSGIACLAVRKGAELRLRTRFLGFQDRGAVLEDLKERKRYRITADYVIGADGARSRVAKLSGEATGTFLPTAQLTLPLRERVEDLLIFFRKYIPGDYGWLFPKGEVANVGVGTDPRYPVKIREVLRRFVQELRSEGLVGKEEVGRSGGLIPAEGMKRPLRGNVLLTGDAGGFCHPITGGGIASAVRTGAMAASALLDGSPESYAEEAEELLGTTLRKAALKRVKYMGSWDDLRFIIPRTWIAFS
jgi:flavin-dependent dehydrogenase